MSQKNGPDKIRMVGPILDEKGMAGPLHYWTTKIV